MIPLPLTGRGYFYAIHAEIVRFLCGFEGLFYVTIRAGGRCMKYSFYNPHPDGRRVGDCTVRALSKALGQDWETTYTGLCLQGFMMHNMPSGNEVWGAYLRRKGFRRNIVPDSCPDCYSVADFADDHPHGTYILALPGHVVCLQDGVLYDTWESQDETVLYYWERNDK